MNKQGVKTLLQIEETEINLKHLCRYVIRKHLLRLDRHGALFNKISELGLPTSLRQYLLYHVNLEYKQMKTTDDGKLLKTTCTHSRITTYKMQNMPKFCIDA